MHARHCRARPDTLSLSAWGPGPCTGAALSPCPWRRRRHAGLRAFPPHLGTLPLRVRVPGPDARPALRVGLGPRAGAAGRGAGHPLLTAAGAEGLPAAVPAHGRARIRERHLPGRRLPENAHLRQEVTFTPAGRVAGQPDVEEGLQGGLRRLALGQLLAASRALERPAVHAHGHDEAAGPL